VKFRFGLEPGSRPRCSRTGGAPRTTGLAVGGKSHLCTTLCVSLGVLHVRIIKTIAQTGLLVGGLGLHACPPVDADVKAKCSDAALVYFVQRIANNIYRGRWRNDSSARGCARPMASARARSSGPTSAASRGVRSSLVHPVFHTIIRLALELRCIYLALDWGERGVRSAQKMRVGPCIPVGRRL
jgi:hypothetical protein